MDYTKFVEGYYSFRSDAYFLVEAIDLPIDAILPFAEVWGSVERTTAAEDLQRRLQATCQHAYNGVVQRLFTRMAPEGPVQSLFDRIVRSGIGMEATLGDLYFRQALQALIHDHDAAAFHPSAEQQREITLDMERIILSSAPVRQGYATYRDRYDIHRLLTCYESRVCLGLFALSEGASLSEAIVQANGLSLALCDSVLEQNRQPVAASNVVPFH